jgi:hypothetical protein
MKKDELKDLMEDILETAKIALVKDGKLRPMAFLKNDDNFGIIPLSFGDNDEKNRQLSALRIIVKEENAEAIFIVTESWYVTTDKQNLEMEPAKDPRRKECIMMMGECEEGNIAIVQIFERENGMENGKIIFGKILDAREEISTRLSFGIKARKKQDKSLRNLN